MEEEQMLTKEQILDMLDAGQYKELKEELGNMYPVDIAETLEDFEQKPLVMCSVSWQKKRLLRHLLI